MRLSTLVTVFTITGMTFASKPRALVYRGPAACNGCPETVAALLEGAPGTGWEVHYAGPKEKIQVNADSLSKVQLYAQPGGGGLSRTWPHLKDYGDDIRDFVAKGGRYAGFCLGAYLAGSGPGFHLLPKGSNTDEECIQKGAQVTNRTNTMIQVDWTFSNGGRKGKTDDGRWVFFQDGAVIQLAEKDVANATILGRYSSNNDIAATVTSYGKGKVGACGPHPEADESWYKPYGIHNPDGIRFDIGYDFISTLMQDA